MFLSQGVTSAVPALVRKLSNLSLQPEVINEPNSPIYRSASQTDLKEQCAQAKFKRTASFRHDTSPISSKNISTGTWKNSPFSDDIERELTRRRKNTSTATKTQSNTFSAVLKAIFKDKTNVEPLPDTSHSILKKTVAQNNNNPSAKCRYLRKQTSFKELVDVRYFDRNRLVSRGSLKLKGEEKFRGNQQHRVPPPKGITRHHSADETQQVFCDSVVMEETQSVSKVKSVFTYKSLQPTEENENASTERKFLTLVIEINRSFQRNKTLVKALGNGRAMVILVCEQLENNEEKQNIEKILLPLRIDPYTVTACVHQNGILVIEAEVDE